MSETMNINDNPDQRDFAMEATAAALKELEATLEQRRQEVNAASTQLVQIIADRKRMEEGIDLLNYLGVMFRQYYRQEIQGGEHDGKSIKQLLAGYIGRERYLYRHWWVRLGRVLRLV